MSITEMGWHHFLRFGIGSVTAILAGIFLIFSYIMGSHEQNPHAGAARHVDIERIELRLDRMDERTDTFREDSLRRLDNLRDILSAHEIVRDRQTTPQR